MKNHLPIPSELQHLIEKREGEERRKGDQRCPTDLESIGSPEAVDNLEEERRRKTDRRQDDGNPPES